jgi:hypothetical protein
MTYVRLAGLVLLLSVTFSGGSASAEQLGISRTSPQKIMLDSTTGLRLQANACLPTVSPNALTDSSGHILTDPSGNALTPP